MKFFPPQNSNFPQEDAMQHNASTKIHLSSRYSRLGLMVLINSDISVWFNVLHLHS